MEESPLPETPPPGDHVTTAVMQDHVTAASAHLTSHTVTVAGLEQSQLAAEPGYGTPGEDSVSTGEEEGGQTEEDEAEQRERERIRMKEQEDAKRCQVCSCTITLTVYSLYVLHIVYYHIYYHKFSAQFKLLLVCE